MPQKNFTWWNHHTDQDLTEKIEGAIRQYEIYRGGQPDWIMVNPDDAGSEYPDELSGVQVLVTSATLPKHFLLGLGEAGV